MGQIALRRKEMGVSTSHLAHRLGLNQSTVVRLEKSEDRKTISLASLERIAEALNCDFQYSFISRSRSEASLRETKVSKKDFKKNSKSRPQSELADAKREDKVKLSCQLKGVERLQRAIEISNFTRKLQCLKKS